MERDAGRQPGSDPDERIPLGEVLAYLEFEDLDPIDEECGPSGLPLNHLWSIRYDDPTSLLFAALSPRCSLSAWFEPELDELNLASLEDCERERRRLANSSSIESDLLPDLIDLGLMVGIPLKPGSATLARLMAPALAALARHGTADDAAPGAWSSDPPELPRVLAAGGQTRLYAPLA